MADRTVNNIYETSGKDRRRVPITTAITLPIGTLVQEEGGYANHYDGTNSFLGLVVGGENTNSDGEPVGDTSLSPVPSVFVDTSGPIVKGIPVTGASAITTIGEHVYCNDSDLDNATLTQPGSDYPIGFITGWRSATDVDVQLYTPAEHLVATTAPAALGADWTT